MKRWIVALLILAAAPARAELPPLISRDLLFGNPERTRPQISPDGQRLAWVAPDAHNVLQVWVSSLDGKDVKAVTADRKRGIRTYFWAQDDRTLVYLQDSDGDENYHLFGVDLPSGNVRDLTPFQGVRAEPMEPEPRHPHRLQCQLNLRDRRLLDVYQIDLGTGALTLDTENPGDVVGWITDDDGVVRGAHVSRPDGGTELRVRSGPRGRWTPWQSAGPDETLALLDFSKDGRSAFLQSSLGADTAGVIERPLAGGPARVVARSEGVDADEIVIHPTRHVIQAVSFAPARRQWTVVDPTVKEDFAALQRLTDGDFLIVSRDRADRTWLVSFGRDSGSDRYYLWDRAGKKGTFLFAQRPKLEGLALASSKPVAIEARDGLVLNSYLTLPVGVPARNLPLVLVVHGGPWTRDYWGFDPTPQLLANRGYAVLQVNYRGSSGYGKKFLNAGDRQWGQAMHTDLVDAVKWAVSQGLADPHRLAIYGGSYGGYAALAGATFTPDLFRCAVDIVGVANLFTWIKNVPPYWGPFMGLVRKRVGDVEDPKDQQLLTRASPLFSADRIKIPMLIGQGANDPRVPQRESEQIVAAIARNGGQATYVLYTDEGHGFARPENRLDFTARMEAFLAQNLGGRAEPMAGEKMPGSTAVLRKVGGARGK
jgi:dipeptidyl aminopeptidase/acylaminoacyl peptidase